MAKDSPLALYRKYRPTTFSEVRGQEAAVRILEGAIAKGAVAHAYLFSGTRGTGKTSIARIFAAALGVTSEDLYEIDAASNRGIDDIRELRSAVFVLPFASPYKLYIIDEAHMLTKEAWNALLKTLEEPPQHVLFILATTEIEKVPDTILSRCQTISFQTPALTVVRDLIVDVATQEKVKLEAGAADLIARAADGSFRDALGVLQKVLVATNDTNVTVNEVAQITGAPRGERVRMLVDRLLHADGQGTFEQIEMLRAEGTAPVLAIELVLAFVRATLLIRLAPSMSTLIEGSVSADDAVLMRTLAKEALPACSSFTLAKLLDAAIAAKRSGMPDMALEIAAAAIIEQYSPKHA
jgi:DNA polymerase-3 subunit gamma/tau